MEGKINRENIGLHLLKMQLSLKGKDLSVLVDDDDWRFNNTLTREQYVAFKNHAYKIIVKVFKCNGRKRNMIFDQFYEMFGLRLKEELLKQSQDDEH